MRWGDVMPEIAKGGPLNEAIDGVFLMERGLVFRTDQEAKLDFCLCLWLKKIPKIRGGTISAESLKIRFCFQVSA